MLAHIFRAYSIEVLTADFSKLIGALECKGDNLALAADERDSLASAAVYHGVVTRLRPSFFAQEQKRNQWKALVNSAHLTRVLAIFQENGVSCLVVKGLALAVRLYGDVGKRHAGDVDLWIEEGQMEKVHEILVGSGHIAKTGYAELSRYYRSAYRRRKFHVGYTHEESGVSVEIHWRLGGTREIFPISFAAALAKKRMLRVGSVNVPTLSDDDHLLFLYVHAARHLWERLFWLYDIVDFHRLEDGPSVGSVLNRAKELGIDRPVLATWLIVEKVLDFEPRIDIAESGDSAARRLAETGEFHLRRSRRGLDPVANWRAALLSHRSWSHKREVLMEFVTAADDWYKLSLPAGFTWIYFLLRPWFLIQRKASVRSREM